MPVALGLEKITEESPEYLGLENVVTDEMAEVAVVMEKRVPITAAEVTKKCGKPLARTEELLEFCDLIKFRKRTVRKLSGGMKRKLMVCRALLTDPEILLLDEPTAGMDALSRRQMWNLLRKLNGKNLTILLTTHYMEEAQNLCSRVALMEHGRLEEVSTPSALINSLGNYTVDEFSGDETKSHYFHTREEAIAYLSGLSGQASLRETTLEDVFVERAGRHLMPS